MIGKHYDISTDERGNKESALISHWNTSRAPKRCPHCKKSGHIVEFCWDLHPERKNMRGRNYKSPSNNNIAAMAAESNDLTNQNEKKRISNE